MKGITESNNSMLKAYVYCIISSGFAFFISIIVGVILRQLYPLVMILLADLAATIVIFIIGLLGDNRSNFYNNSF